MKKYIFPFLAIVLLLTGCFKEEDELLQEYTVSGNVSVEIIPTNDVISSADLENSYLSFIIDTVIGTYQKISVRVYYKQQNASAILEEFTSVPSGELVYSVPEMLQAVGASMDDIEALDEFNIEVLITSNGVTSASQAGAFTGRVIIVGPVAGIYDVYATSYGDPGNWDEQWVVIVQPGSDETTFTMVGVAGGTKAINAKIDMDAGTVSIAPGQDVGNAYGYGPTIVAYDDGSVNQAITGTRSENGDLAIDMLGLLLVNYGNYHWDTFNTAWTKR